MRADRSYPNLKENESGISAHQEAERTHVLSPAAAKALEALKAAAAKGLLEDRVAALVEDRVTLASLTGLRVHRIVAVVEALA